MRIKNISQFLATSAFVLCSAFSATQSMASPGAYLNGVDVEGNRVKMARASDLTPQEQADLAKREGGGAYKFEHDQQFLCAVKVDPIPQIDLVNRHYANYSNDPMNSILFAGNVSDYYLAAHELSHCFNHNRMPTSKPLLNMMANPVFSEYGEPLEMLEKSILEVYADLSAVMLGASKTGDWTVFSDGVMRARSALPDPLHLTSYAVTSIILKIDPKTLKGKRFDEINAQVNEAFKQNFMNDQGQINITSPGVARIMQEMMFFSKRLRAYAAMHGVPIGQSQKLKAQARVVEDFAGKAYTHLSVGDADFALLTALQIIDARQQQVLARETQATSSKGERQIERIVKGMEDRQNASLFAYRNMAENKEGAQQLLDSRIAMIEKWIESSRSNDSAALLTQDIGSLVAENSSMPMPDSLAERKSSALAKASDAEIAPN